MSELPEQLRASAEDYHVDQDLVNEAADRIDKLEAALRDAIECIEDWGAYADDYFKEKWDLKGDIARARRALEGNDE